MIISTFSAVLSSIFFIFIFPLSFAFIIESIKLFVVVEKGISVITNVLVSIFFIFALTFTTLPRNPLLYLETSA